MNRVIKIHCRNYESCVILYSTSNNLQLVGYTYSDFARSIDDRKSTYGYAFHLGTGVVAWASKKQPIVTISSIEAGYVEGTSTTCCWAL